MLELEPKDLYIPLVNQGRGRTRRRLAEEGRDGQPVVDRRESKREGRNKRKRFIEV
jgi:hypothetical protein